MTVRFWHFTHPARLASRHLTDDDLTVFLLGGPLGTGTDAAHVADCRRCATRLAALEALLAEDRHRLVAEADAAVTPSRLERQRAAILRAIGGSRAAARILPFPHHGPVTATTRRSLIQRSVAAAALAGLVIGGVAGRLLGPRHTATQPAMVNQARALSSPVADEPLQVSDAGDEAFLLELEAAIGEPRLEPLSALDALTPQPVATSPPQ
jgi:hypothetical protein